jgi:hypothetical protein
MTIIGLAITGGGLAVAIRLKVQDFRQSASSPVPL